MPPLPLPPPLQKSRPKNAVDFRSHIDDQRWSWTSCNLSTFQLLALSIRWKCLWRNVKFANKNTAQWLEFWCQLSSFSTAVVTLRGLLSISRKRCRGVAINFATRCWSSFLIQRDAPTLVEPLDVMLLLRSCTISSFSQNKMWLKQLTDGAARARGAPRVDLDHCQSRLLTLFKPGGGTLCPSCHLFAYNRANTPTSVLEKLDFSNYEFGKGPYTFYPIKYLV